MSKRLNIQNHLGTIRLSSLLLVALFLISGCSQSVLPRFALGTLDNPHEKIWDSCNGKSRCVVAYFAPWCPICHKSVPFFKELRRQLAHAPQVGLVYVVGYDRSDACEDFAAEIGSPVYLDPRREFDTFASFSSVPHFWVLDKDRKVINDFSWTGSRDGKISQAVEYFIENDLELGELGNLESVPYREQDLPQ